jgi:hypothetical protein
VELELSLVLGWGELGLGSWVRVGLEAGRLGLGGWARS